MTREDIIQAVKVKLEEQSPFDDGLLLFSDNNEFPIISYIDQSIDEAADEVRLLLPLKMISSDTIAGVVVVTDNLGKITLPSDFLRIHTIQHSAWERSIHKAIFAEHPDYNLQSNRYTRGGNAKPVVVIDEDEVYGKVLLLYTVPDGAMLKQLYVRHKPAEDCEDITIPYIILMAAIKVSNYFARFDSSKALTEELQNKLQLVNQ